MTCPAPNLVTQLCTTDGKKRPDPTSGSDCAMACAKMAIRFATCNKVSPSIEQIREQSGLDEPNPPPDDFSTTATEYAKAVNAFDDEAQAKGFEGINAGVHERQPWDDLAEVIKQEQRWVTVYIDYGVVNDSIPAKSGDKNFRGAHAISVFGYNPSSQTSSGQNMAKVYDPLDDGRKPDIPKGPVWWPMWVVREAADAYAGGGDGNATWITTPRAKVVTEPPPEPEPCEDRLAMGYDLLAETVQHLSHSKDERALRRRILEFLPDTSEAANTVVRPGAK